MTTRTPSLEAALEDALIASRRAIWTMLPGRLVAVTLTAPARADVQLIPAEDQGGEVSALPPLLGLRILWPAGNAGSIVWPLAVGDRVMVLFASRPLGHYLGDASEGDPLSPRTHHLSDAVVLPFGFAPDSAGRVMPTHLSLVAPTGGEVHLGSEAAAAAVCLAPTIEAQMNILLNLIVLHRHNNTVPVDATLVPLAAGIAGTGATLVKAV